LLAETLVIQAGQGLNEIGIGQEGLHGNRS
jgi:hypothetical protein